MRNYSWYRVIGKDAKVELKGSDRKSKNHSGGGQDMKQIKPLKWKHKYKILKYMYLQSTMQSRSS